MSKNYTTGVPGQKINWAFLIGNELNSKISTDLEKTTKEVAPRYTLFTLLTLLTWFTLLTLYTWITLFTWFSLLTWFTLFTWFTLLSWLTLFILFKLLYTAQTEACMPLPILLGKVRTLLEWADALLSKKLEWMDTP